MNKICILFITQALKLLMQCNYDTSEALQRLQVDDCPQSGETITSSCRHCSRIICCLFSWSVQFMTWPPQSPAYFADDVALLAEMLSVLVLALEVMNEGAQPLGLTINWAKTKIQTTDVSYCTTWLYSPSWWKQCGGSRYLYISWLSTSQLRWKRA